MPAESRDLGLARGLGRYLDGQLVHAVVAYGFAADQERIAGHKRGGKAFLDLAKRAAATPANPDADHFLTDDRPDIHAQEPCGAWVAQLPSSVDQDQALPAFIGTQRITSGRGEIEAAVEIGAAQIAVGACGFDLGKQVAGVKRTGAGGVQDMLAKNLQRARGAVAAVQLTLGQGINRGDTFDCIEAVDRHQPRHRGAVVLVVRAPDPLRQALDLMGRADLDNLIDIAPINAQIKAAGRDDRAQGARRHRIFDLGALLARKRAVVKGDRQGCLVGKPEGLEKQLGLGAGVDENDARICGFNRAQNIRHGIAPAGPRPRGRQRGRQKRDIGFGAGVGNQKPRAPHESRKILGVIDRRRKPCRDQSGRKMAQSCKGQHQLIAAFALGQSVQLVQNDAPEIAEDFRGLGIGQHQGQAFGRRQQNRGRIDALTPPPRRGRVAGPVLDADFQRHIGNRAVEIARNIDRQRLQGGHVKRMEALMGLSGQVDQRGQKPRQRLSAACRRDQQMVFGLIQQRELMRMGLPALRVKPVAKPRGERGHSKASSAERWSASAAGLSQRMRAMRGNRIANPAL